jgi:hypothetical protein
MINNTNPIIYYTATTHLEHPLNMHGIIQLP